MNHCIRSRQHFKVGNCWMWLQYCSPSNRVRVPSRNILPAWSKASWAPSMNIPSQKNRKRSIDIQYIQFRSFPCFPGLHFERLYKKGRCTRTKKRAYGRCSRREIKGNEISTEPVLHNGSQPCHIPGANICLNGVEPFGKTLTFLRKRGKTWWWCALFFLDALASLEMRLSVIYRFQ